MNTKEEQQRAGQGSCLCNKTQKTKEEYLPTAARHQIVAKAANNLLCGCPCAGARPAGRGTDCLYGGTSGGGKEREREGGGGVQTEKK